jgi:hypothetical protein
LDIGFYAGLVSIEAMVIAVTWTLLGADLGRVCSVMLISLMIMITFMLVVDFIYRKRTKEEDINESE